MVKSNLLCGDFKNICDCFVDSKLGIHFGVDKTKTILLWSKQRATKICKLNERCKVINIKQWLQVTYLACVLDESMSVKSETLKVINQIYGKLKFLCRKNRF